jgi:predicted small secreted protein
MFILSYGVAKHLFLLNAIKIQTFLTNTMYKENSKIRKRIVNKDKRMRFLILFMLLGVTSVSLVGCFSFRGAGEEVGITGQMIPGTWMPGCPEGMPCCERRPCCGDRVRCCE